MLFAAVCVCSFPIYDLYEVYTTAKSCIEIKLRLLGIACTRVYLQFRIRYTLTLYTHTVDGDQKDGN